MQVIPDESDDGEETRDGADDEAPVDQAEVFDVFVLLQEDLRTNRATGLILCFLIRFLIRFYKPSERALAKTTYFVQVS